MNRYLKFGLIIFSFLLVLIIGAIVYIQMVLPDVGNPPESIRLTNNSETLNRGKYLANHVMLCIDCHSKRDFSLYSGPPIPGTEGAGGEIFDQDLGFPGRFISPNITPFNLKSYSDGELFRLITTGVKKRWKSHFSYYALRQLRENGSRGHPGCNRLYKVLTSY